MSEISHQADPHIHEFAIEDVPEPDEFDDGEIDPLDSYTEDSP